LRITADYHTHTVYSRHNHGKGSIRDNAMAAYKKGLRTVAISDHGPGHYIYGVKRELLPHIRKEIDAINEEMRDKDFRVLLGVEANVISYKGDWDLDDRLIELTDIRAAGFHYGVHMKGLSDTLHFFLLNPLARFIPPLRRYMRRKNTDALIALIQKYPITFLSHPGEKAEVEIDRLAKACAKEDVWLEINASHEQLDIESIKTAMQVAGAKFVINSDAHRPETIGEVEAGIVRAKRAGLPADRIVNAVEQEEVCKSS
jgi:putative hydrolase